MITKMELFYEPLEILNNLSSREAEMTEWQSAFLCGLIKAYRPKKIVEVGVAAGGTTAILLNCFSMLKLDSELHSIDISEKYYKDRNKETGYLAEEAKEILNYQVKHNKYFGVLPEYLADIGDDIDFLILDTMHVLPGEILDFLACFPKMKKGGCIVLHDIILNHLSEIDDSYATKVLLSSVVGEKIICQGDSTPYLSPGIGAFLITDDTKKYIENVFSALTITWKYIPDSNQLKIYRDYYSRYYENCLVEEYDDAVAMNTGTLHKRDNKRKEMFKRVLAFLREIEEKENVFIYGCGEYGTKLCRLLESYGIEVKGYIISDNQKKLCRDKCVSYVSEIVQDDCTIILGMNSDNQKSLSLNSEAYIHMDDLVLDFLRDYV